MSMNLVTLLYLIASVCFIQSLKGLSHPTTSIRGNLFGMVGMAIAAFTTAALIVKLAGSPLGLRNLAWLSLDSTTTASLAPLALLDRIAKKMPNGAIRTTYRTCSSG